MGSRFKYFLLLLMLFGLIPNPVFAEEWYISYKAALKAVEEQNWSEAIKYLEDAVSDKPLPAQNAKTTGLRYITYTPYFYLGFAYYKQGKCAEALGALKKSRDYGIIRNVPDKYQLLDSMMTDCEKKTAAAAQEQTGQVKPVESQNAKLIDDYLNEGENQFNDEKLEEALESFKLAKGLIERTGERRLRLAIINEKIARLSRRIQVRKGLERANGLYENGKISEAVSEVKNILELDPGSIEAKRMLDFLSNVQKKNSESAQIKTPVVKTPETGGTKEDFKNLIKAAGSSLQNGDYISARGKANAALAIKENDAEAERLLRTIDYSEGVDTVNSAIESYFRGDTGGCRKKLDSAVKLLSTMPEYKEKLMTAYLFQAAALIDQHFLEGRTTDELLIEASGKMKEVYKINPSFVVDEKYFSSKVVSLMKK